MSRRWILGAVAVFLLAAAAWWWSRRTSASPLASGACGRCNVLLITVDTLRRDRVGAFGGPPGLTPALDRLAAEGLRLTRAYSAAPLTLPSHASILTAVSPPVHGVRANGLFRLGPSLPTLATVLKAAGYRTGAFVGSFVLDARFGLNRGFDVYDDRIGEPRPGEAAEEAERRADEVTAPAIEWILRGSGIGDRGSDIEAQRPRPGPWSATPWFAWVHLYDPHEPYRAPEPYASQHAPYDAEVAYVDATIARFLSSLDAADQLDRTLIVVAADHGESLGEHGERSHGVFAYDVTLQVPWIVWSRHAVRANSFDGLARLIDLAPTTLDVVGVPAPREFEGRSLLGAIAAGDTNAPPAYFEAMEANLTRNWAPLSGVVNGAEKFIDVPVPEMYNLARDPHETTNEYSRNTERARTLESLLRSTTSAYATRGAAAQQTTLPAEAVRRLQALGYVGAAAERPRRVYTDADDPKALIGAANDVNQAQADFKAGRAQAAIAAVVAIINQHPQFSTAYGVLASMQRDAGDLAGAIETLEQLMRRGIADQSVMVVLAGYLQEAGSAAKSAELLEAVVAQHPDYADAYNSLGVAYSRIGRHDRAQAAFQKVLELDPTAATAYENLGVDDLGRGDAAAAITHLQRATELDPRLARAHNALAAAYQRQRRLDDAVAHWRKALEIEPRLYDAMFNAGVSLWDAGRHDEARPYLERFVNEAPTQRYAPDIARLKRMLAR